MAKAKAATVSSNPASMTVYACGGTGINVVKKIKDLDLDTYYIDGSDANSNGLPSDYFYQVPGMRGAGKDRSVTNDMMKDGEVVENILIRFKPNSVLNVLVLNAAGGSGSVIAMHLAKALLEKNLPVIVIAIDSRTSTKELVNSHGTFVSMRKLSKATRKSLTCFYALNTSRKEADQKAIQFINLLSLITDKSKTEEADPSDLFNFLNFDKVTENAPNVGMIDVGENEPVTPKRGEAVVSTMFVTSDRDATLHPVTPEYLSTVIVTDPEFSVSDIRIDNVLGRLPALIQEFETKIENQANEKKINKVQDYDVDVDDSEDFMSL